MLELRGVSKVYRSGGREVHALRGVTARVEPGEVTFVVGPSGSGKTTFLNVAGCLDRPTSGEVRIGGRDASAMDDSGLTRLRRDRIGFVFQTFNLVPTLTARENVELPLEFAGAPREERRKRSRELLRRVGLAEVADHRPAELSGGQAQRVAVARALVNDPSVVLCDEPTGNLDRETGESVMSLLRGLRRDGAAVVVVTHDTGIIERDSRVLRLRDGELDAAAAGA